MQTTSEVSLGLHLQHDSCSPDEKVFPHFRNMLLFIGIAMYVSGIQLCRCDVWKHLNTKSLPRKKICITGTSYWEKSIEKYLTTLKARFGNTTPLQQFGTYAERTRVKIQIFTTFPGINPIAELHTPRDTNDVLIALGKQTFRVSIDKDEGSVSQKFFSKKKQYLLSMQRVRIDDNGRDKRISAVQKFEFNRIQWPTRYDNESGKQKMPSPVVFQQCSRTPKSSS